MLFKYSGKYVNIYFNMKTFFKGSHLTFNQEEAIFEEVLMDIRSVCGYLTSKLQSR